MSFHGTGGSLYGIYIVNIFLIIITLGIYSFWARVRVREFFMSQTEFAGDRFAYHGSGKELLIGFSKAMLVFGVPIGVLNAIPDLLDIPEWVKITIGLLSFVVTMMLIPFATVATRRYRLSRSSWRGIRFTFRGLVWDFIKLFLGGSFLTTATLGLYYPFFATRKYAFLTSHSYFGNEKFSFDGEGKDLFGSFVLAILLTIPTLGICWFWFMAKKHRYLWDHTSFATSRFHSTLTGDRLLLLKLGNLLLLIVTIGLGWSWIRVRTARFYLGCLSSQGPIDLAGIEQEAQLATATGEGLASFFDLDAGFDLG
ncbi:MAG: DUF898 domain-containing protein [Deltaproteobacteria bacterium]|nr:DUF898 domain-containing protein [Deltaproteobacteria bacterium]